MSGKMALHTLNFFSREKYIEKRQSKKRDYRWSEKVVCYKNTWDFDMGYGESRFNMMGGWDAPRNNVFTSRLDMEYTQNYCIG
jgi:hypothetical protein